MDPTPGVLPPLPRPSALGRDGWDDLLCIAGDAFANVPPLYVSSVLGLPWTWLPCHRRFSEFHILDVWHLARAARFLVDVTVPAITAAPPPFGLPLLNRLIWRPTIVLQHPDHRGSFTSYPREAWIFVNGILTNDGVARLNAAYLADLFHRPITVVQNSTGAITADLVECALGKQWLRATESVRCAFPLIYDALKSEKERVVVIAHSQGTIIMSVVLRLLQESLRLGPPSTRRGPRPAAVPLDAWRLEEWRLRLEEFEPVTVDDLTKLEIYALANCANTMTFVDWDDPAQPAIPWIESFGNQYDIVAGLGMLAPKATRRGIRIDGPRYVRRCGWGHLLNDHYLQVIDDAQRVGHRRGGNGTEAPYELVNPEAPHEPAPRLFAYLNGGTPALRGRGPVAQKVAAGPAKGRRATRRQRGT